MIIEVSTLGYLPHLPFGAIGPLGTHNCGCTLELNLQPYWLAQELLLEDRSGAENHAQLQFGMWLVALLAPGDHAAPLLLDG